MEEAKNHNQNKQPSPEVDYSSLDQEAKDNVNQLIHTPLTADELYILVEKMHADKKKVLGSGPSTEYTEALLDNLNSFRNTDGVDPSKTYITFHGLREATEKKHSEIAPRGPNGTPNPLSLNAGAELFATIESMPGARYILDEVEDNTMQSTARGKRKKDGQADPFSKHRIYGGIATWKTETQSSASGSSHEKKQKGEENYPEKLVSTPLPVEKMRELIDIIEIKFEDDRNDKAVAFIEDLRKKLDSLGDADSGEHVDLRLLIQAAEKPTEEGQPAKSSKGIRELIGKKFEEEFNNLAEVDPDLQDMQKDIDKFTLHGNYPDPDNPDNQQYGFEGRWAPEDHEDVIVWLTKEQKAYNDQKEREVETIKIKRDLGSKAARSVGITQAWNKFLNDFKSQPWKNLQESRKAKKDKLVREQQTKVNNTKHKKIKERRQAELDRRIDARNKVSDRIGRISNKMESRESKSAAKRDKWLEKRAEALGRKEVRDYIKGQNDYSRSEKRELKNSITQEQKIEIGKIALARKVAQRNIEYSQRDVDSLSSHKDSLRERLDSLVNEKNALKADKRAAFEEEKRLGDKLADLEQQQNPTDEVRYDIELTKEAKNRVSRKIKMIDQEILNTNNNMSATETELGDLNDSIPAKTAEHQQLEKFANKRRADYDELEKTFWENIEDSNDVEQSNSSNPN